MKTSRRHQSYLIITLCYIGAALLGIWVFQALRTQLWLSLLIADLAATLFIWVASLLLGNASVYDPYWSVQPPIILTLTLILIGNPDPGSILLILAVAFWGARLSANWVVTFPGLHQQDWRYDQLKEQSKGFFPLVSLFGIQIMPTLIVYACLLPGFYYLVRGGGMNFGVILGIAVIVGGTLLELTADHQMQQFRKTRRSKAQLIRTGLWKYSRHPNYLGEISVWWGVYLVLLSTYPGLWYLGAGALANTCLFLFISIPLADKHLASYKENYAAYRKETRMLFPIPKRKK